MNSLQKVFVLFSVLVLSSCSSLSWLKFWGDDEEEEGPADLYSILENRTLDRQWSISNSNDFVSGRLIPVVYDGNVYHISSSGNLLSIDLESGKKLWSKSTEDVISTGLDVNFKTITYGTLDGQLVTLDQRNGQEIWRSQTSSESLSPPVHSGSHIVIQTIDGRITGFNAKTGQQDWFYQTVVPTLTLRGTSWPYIDQGFVFTGFANGKIARFILTLGL